MAVENGSDGPEGTKPKGRGARLATGHYAKDPEVQARAVVALEMRTRGLSLRHIAAELGMSIPGVHHLIQRALRDTIQPAADELRQLELEKLDRMERISSEILADQYEHVAANGKLAGVIDPRPRLMAIDRLVKISESRRKLLGLDAPQVIEHLPIKIEVNGVDVGNLT